MKIIGMFLSMAIITVAVVVISCQTPKDKKAEIVFKIKQLDRKLTNLDLDAPGFDAGDELLFEGAIVDEAGNKGSLIGETKIIEMPDSLNKFEGEDRISNIVFRFGGDQLIVLGETVYPKDSMEMRNGVSQIRAVIGGTGKYIGASGEVKTTKSTAGTYEHEFRLIH